MAWVWTAWPNGARFILPAASAIILFARREDVGSSRSAWHGTHVPGSALTAIRAPPIGFAVLPHEPRACRVLHGDWPGSRFAAGPVMKELG